MTIRDVAKRAGVSIATVSRVLNQSKPVSEELRNRILQAVEETGYLPNAVARSMIRKQTGLIGVIIPEISNPYFSGLVQGIETVAKQNQYYLMLAVSEKEPGRERELLRIYQARQMDGIILASARLDPELRQALEKLAVPYVVIGQRLTGLNAPCAVLDNRRAAFEAVSHLIRMGHREIGMVSGPMWDLASGKERYQGFRDALEEAGLPFRTEWVTEREGFHLHDGYEGMKVILGAPERPTAVFCACDRMAVGALRRLEERGIPVPEEMALVGFDDEELASIVKPRLTTVRHSPFDMGLKAAGLLMEILKGLPLTDGTCALVKHDLVIRESSSLSLSPRP